jgi:hypothetical protein
MTDKQLLDEVLAMLKPAMPKPLTHEHVFVDLGCGDGRVCIQASQV